MPLSPLLRELVAAAVAAVWLRRRGAGGGGAAAAVGVGVLAAAALRLAAALLARRRRAVPYSEPAEEPGMAGRFAAWDRALAASGVTEASPYADSAEACRRFIRAGVFSGTRDFARATSAALFACQRERANVVEIGLATRVTVQCNLFAGCVANLGSPAQQAWLDGVWARGELGCFLLTEQRAGVLSGLIVDTTAQWTPEGYVLHTPEPVEVHRKVWISQGLVARWGVVVARLLLAGGEDRGPHAFIIDMETAGVRREDMPRKTALNSLDNAYVSFAGARLPLDALLSGVSRVTPDGEYRLSDPAVPFRFVHVAQRLLAGRICLSGSALSFVRDYADRVEEYGAEQRHLPVGKTETVPLSELPCVRDALRDVRGLRAVFKCYIRALERAFMRDAEISPALEHRIACAKILAVDFAIAATAALKARVGAMAVQAHGPFGARNDVLWAIRFAEGDSAILMQKMARDSVRALRGAPALAAAAARAAVLPLGGAVAQARGRLALDRLRLVARMQGARGRAQTEAWLEAHRLVEGVARQTACLTVYDTVRGEMAGTAELELFRDRYLAGGRCGVV